MRNLPQKYFPLIENFQSARAGGITVEKYCRLHSINTKTFYYWKKKYQTRKTASREKGFAPLRLEVSHTFASIHYHDGTRLVLEQAMSPEALRELIPAFRS